MTTTRAMKTELADGGVLCLNPCGQQGWTIDVWSWDAGSSDDPIYHAWYGTRDEAMSDAAGWRTWEQVKR